MRILKYRVLKRDSLLSICSKFNVSIDIIINCNLYKYPKLAINPFVIMENWILDIPLIGNGNDTEYGIRTI